MHVGPLGIAEFINFNDFLPHDLRVQNMNSLFLSYKYLAKLPFPSLVNIFEIL